MLFKKLTLLVISLDFFIISPAFAAGPLVNLDQNGSEFVSSTNEGLLQENVLDTDSRNRMCRCEWLTALPRRAAARSYEFCKRQVGEFYQGAVQPKAIRAAATWINCYAIYVSLKTAHHISRLQHQLASRDVSGLPDDRMLPILATLGGYIPVLFQGAVSLEAVYGLYLTPSLQNSQILASLERSSLSTAIVTLGVKSAVVLYFRNTWPELQDLWDQIFVDEFVLVLTKLSALPFTITYHNQVYVRAQTGVPSDTR